MVPLQYTFRASFRRESARVIINLQISLHDKIAFIFLTGISCKLIFRKQHSTPGHFFQRNENMYSFKNLYTNVYVTVKDWGWCFSKSRNTKNCQKTNRKLSKGMGQSLSQPSEENNSAGTLILDFETPKLWQ